MALEQRTTPYGPAAFQALRAALDELQSGDRLRPVTVLVYSNAVGVAARRWLASHGGVAAAQFVTTFRFAELLGGPSLAASGRRPVSTPVIDVAVRSALATSSGLLSAIAHHRATVAGLRDTHRELRHLPPVLVRRLTEHGSARAREVVRVHLAVQEVLAADWYDEADLLRAAAGATGAAPTDTIVFLPQRLRPTEHALLQALGQHGRTVVITGEAQPPTTVPLHLVDASDADEEAREAVRIVLDGARAGVPLHRMGIVWPRHEPYARLIAEHLREAEIAWNGRPGVAVHERLAARLVLDLMRLDRRGIRRAELFALLSHVPARTPDGDVVPRQLWERLSRNAGLAADADWQPRLTAYAEQQRSRGREPEAEAAAGLLAFITDLRGELGDTDATERWELRAELCHRLLLRWLGGHRGVQILPADEFEAFTVVQASLDRLSRLDALAAPCTRREFADTLEAELDSAPGRVGRIGVGVHIGPLAFAVGQPFDRLVVVGACDGLLPAPPPAEAMLGDADRALTEGAMAVNAEVTIEQQRQLWAAMSGATEVFAVSPRGDLRATASRVRSRWIDEVAVHGTTDRRSVPSFAAGMNDTPFPTTTTQHRIRALTDARRRGEPLPSHHLVRASPALQRGVAMITARESAVLTEFDGDLSGLHIDPLGSGPVSPTRLENWVACPHAWFMQYVLGLQPVEQPDEQLQITPKDRGTLVHDALDEFHQRVINGELPQPGPEGWAPEHFVALDGAFQHQATLLEKVGATGRTAFWRSEQLRQRHELAMWLRIDSQFVARRGAQVVASEFSFGDPGPPAVTALTDGTVVRWRGQVDRIDRCADGRLVVTDHKTGSATSYRAISNDDPTAGGTKVQLPAYAAAALAYAGEPSTTAVIAEYGFLGKAKYQRTTVEIGQHGWPQVQRAIERIVGGIRSGLFVARPDKSQFKFSYTPCEYCDPDHLGTADAWRRFERKLSDPRVPMVLGLAALDDEGADDE
jgi:hypothetical protein